MSEEAEFDVDAIYEEEFDVGAIYDTPDDDYKEPDDVGEGPSGPPPLRYAGADDIPEIPTREALMERLDRETVLRTRDEIKRGAPLYFMPNDVEEAQDYDGGVQVYKLHLWGPLIDGTKAHVIIDGIPCFFDILVPAVLPKSVKAVTDASVPPADRAVRDFEAYWRFEFMTAGIPITKYDNAQVAFPIRGYQEKPSRYIRVFTADTRRRKEAIELVRARGYTTANDDLRSYVRKVSRENRVPFCDWLVLSKYTYAPGRSTENDYGRRWANDPVSAHVFRVALADIRPVVNPLDSEEDRARQSAVVAANPLLARDRTLVFCWDIETYSPNNTGDLPDAKNDEDKCFLISITAHWKDSAEPLYTVSFVDKDTNPDKRWTTVVCGTEQNVIRGMFVAWRKLGPDVEAAFNSGEYDWPFVVEKLRRADDLGWAHRMASCLPRKNATTQDVHKWNYGDRPRQVKITAETSHGVRHLKLPGCVPVDVRLCFMKLYPKSEVSKGSSLRFYLKMCKLPSKADMPIARMWKIYRDGDAEGLRKAVHYCVIDALSCIRLLLARAIIGEAREVSALSFGTLFDSLYYAGGIKVCNLLIAASQKRKTPINCSNITQERKEEGKYPGAWVFPPKKGLHADRPTTGVDAASLYPSVIMTYNLSPEKMIFDEAEAKRVAASGRALHYIEFLYNGRVRRAWCVRHGNDPKEYGLYPEILMDLFARRKALKKQLGVLKMKKECLELVMGSAKAAKTSLAAALKALPATLDKDQAAYVSGLPADDAAIAAEYEAVSFQYVKINTKQGAVKVYMNTFYGETGNQLSPFFMVELAGGVTTGGVATIKKSVDFALKEGMRMLYGDTDSMYLIPADKHYAECDADHRAGRTTREEYWAAMVRVTMTVMSAFIERLNAFHKKDNGTGLITFAYEEVLFPVVFTGKKKYWGIPHIGVPNFHPKELFVRGIDVVKIGQTELAKTIGYRCMWKAVSVDNTQTLREIVEEVVRDAATNTAQWSFDYFIQTDAYKPNKDNKSVKRFIARMRPRRAAEVAENRRLLDAGRSPNKQMYELPEVGERFSYVIVRKSDPFDLRGYRATAKKGDLMEFAHVARAMNMPVDIAYYLTAYVIGLCARFINYDAEFQPPALSSDRSAVLRRSDAASDAEFQPPAATDEIALKNAEKAIDDFAQKRAKKHLEDLVRGCGGIDRKVVTARGYAYKRAFRGAERLVRESAATRVGTGALVLHGNHLSFDLFLDDEESLAEGPSDTLSRCIDRIVRRAREVGERVTRAAWDAKGAREAAAARLGITPAGADIGDPKASRALIAKSARRRVDPQRKAYECLRSETHRAVSEVLPKVMDIAMKYEVDLEHAVSVMREQEHKNRPELGEVSLPGITIFPSVSLDDDDKETLAKFRTTWYYLAGVYSAMATSEKVREYLDGLRAARLKLNKKPADAEADPVPRPTRPVAPVGIPRLD
ncbi:MAG: hypothetical protein KGL39_10945 [Patescibacteria group bacterium]|nr:hypothetical protein [Patescibacteria group bacterium]